MNKTKTRKSNKCLAEILSVIIDFTKRRDKLLSRNIFNINNRDYEPVDLDVEGFSDTIALALYEYMTNERIVMKDTEDVRFRGNGKFSIKPKVDKYAKQLFEKDIEKYLEFQIKSLTENMINLRVAKRLLNQSLSVGAEIGG